MKTIATTLALVASLLTQGCKTTDGRITPERMATTAKVAAYVGTSLYLQREPDKRPAFEMAEASLTALIESESFDPLVFHRVLSQLPIKELRGGDAAVIVGAAMILWQEYQLDVSLDQLEKVRPVMVGTRDGVKMALAVTGG